MPATIIQGNFTKSLKSKLSLNDVAYILPGTVDPTVVAQDAPAGSVYLRGGVTPGLYLKDDAGLSVNWTPVTSGAISSVIGKQEALAGIVDGVNTDFTLTSVPLNRNNIALYLDDIIVPESNWTFAGTTVTFLTPPALGQSVYAFYLTPSATMAIGFQEVPAGVVNGVNDTFVLTKLPLDAGSTSVFVNNLVIPSSEWSLVGSSIVFNAGSIPALGQSVYVFYLFQGNAPAVTIPTNNEQLEFRTITPGEVAAKQLTLSATPVSSTKVMLDYIGIGPQFFPTDYTIAANILDWSGLGLDGVVSAGDQFRIHYFS